MRPPRSTGMAERRRRSSSGAHRDRRIREAQATRSSRVATCTRRSAARVARGATLPSPAALAAARPRNSSSRHATLFLGQPS